MKRFIIDNPEDLELIEDVLQCWLIDNPFSCRQWRPVYELFGRLKKVIYSPAEQETPM